MSSFINNQIYAPINDYVKLFLQAASDKDQERWNSPDNQDNFNKLVMNLVNNKKMNKKMKKALKKSLEKDNESVSRPKKVKSDYICFCMCKRPELKEKHPEMTNKAITTELGKLWQLIKNDPSELQIFKEMVNKDKERFQNEMSQQPITEKKTKKAKNADGVQKNLSGYIIFCKDVRETVKTENPELNNKQIMTEMGNRWKNADEATKKKYEQLASADKERYLREKSAHGDGASESKEVEPEPEVVVEAPVPESAPAPKKKVSKKKKAEAVVEEPVLVPEPVPESVPAPAAPVAKKTGNNGYINYSKLMRASVSAETGLDFKGTTGELSKRWKALSDDDKQKYKEGTQVSA
jgi:hypothetical protein